jgi:hypothetical protein
MHFNIIPKFKHMLRKLSFHKMQKQYLSAEYRLLKKKDHELDVVGRLGCDAVNSSL